MIREATAADLPRIIELNKIIMNDMEHSMSPIMTGRH